jgi:Glycosyltransferase family 87
VTARATRSRVVRTRLPLSASAFVPLLPGLGIFLAVVVTVIAVHHAPRTDASPIEPFGDWRIAYRAAVVAAFALYAVAVVVFRARRRAATTAVLVVAAAIQFAPLAAPLLLSKDVYTYWNKGRIGAVHRANIFATAPSAFPNDPSYPYVAEDWRDREFFYGPTMAGVAEGDAAIAGVSRPTAVGIFRVVAAVSVVAAALLVTIVAPRPAFGAVLVGWNPVLALHFAGGGHNDALMMALFAGSLVLAARRRRVFANLAWVAAAALKWTLLAFVPLQVLARRRPFAGKSLAVVVAGLVAASFAVWGTAWITSLRALRSQSNTPSSNSFAWWLSDHVGGSRLTWVHVIIALFVVAYAVLAVQAWRTGRARVGLAAGFLVAATPFLGPWYLMWPATLTAVEEDDVAVLVLVLLTAWLLRDAVGV